MEAKQTSLIELLEAVPVDARLVVDDGPHSTSFYPVGRMCHGAAAALRERLAQPEPEPVAWMRDGEDCTDCITWFRTEDNTIPLYTAQQPRQWQGLTGEEVGALTVFDGLHHVEVPVLADFIRAIEAKLKEKNK